MNNNIFNKESIQLLNATSSDSDSASDMHFSFVPPQPPTQVRRKIRTKRKSRREGGVSQSAPPSWSPCSLCSFLKTASISFAVGGTLILGWMVILLHSELRQLSEKLANVPNASYNEEIISGFRRTIRELSLNHSDSYHAIQNHSRIVGELKAQTGVMALDINNIKDSLKAAPQMMNIAKELDSLKGSLASYEARISDLGLGLKELKDSSLPKLLETMQTINSTLQTKSNGNSLSLLHQNGLISSMGEGLRNVSMQLSSLTIQPDRVNAIHSALMDLEAQQKNTTLTLKYIQEVVRKLDSVQAKPGA